MNEILWCYQLNESSLVELLLSAIYLFIFFWGGGGGGGGGGGERGISLKKKSGIFVSFPFSIPRSEMLLTLSILYYVNVGVAENLFLIKNNAVSFSVVLRA